MEERVEIDGRTGGGQMLRTALSLSLITGRSFAMRNIRLARESPGMRSQHQIVVEAAAAVSGAEVEGDVLHSTDVRFSPRETKPGNYAFDIGMASSSVFLLQTIALPLALLDSPSTLELRGATHAPFAPPYPFAEDAWVPTVRALGLAIDVTLERPGFYPRGGGLMRVAIGPGRLDRPFQRGDRGELEGVRVRSITGLLPFHVGERQLNRVVRTLQHAGVAAVGGTETLLTEAPGTVIQLAAQFRSGANAFYTALGKKGESAEEVADLAVDAFLRFLDTKANIDEYLADQILLAAALTEGGADFIAPVGSRHLAANVAVVNAFFPNRVRREWLPGGEVRLIVDGAAGPRSAE